MKEICIPNPSYDSNLVSVILDLEKLRIKQLASSVPHYIFSQLKDIFHILETLGSARIEGNNTTLSEYVEDIIKGGSYKDEKIGEIKNIEKAIKFIEKNINEKAHINRAFIFEVHKILTKGLTPPSSKGEGATYPGELRKCDVHIKGSSHNPPSYLSLEDYFLKFIDFINSPYKKQLQLLMVAVAHHRFEYIHPFDNGNGRVGRLLNYALLIKLGFNVKEARIINPSSIFYGDRNKYYDMLKKADSLSRDDILEWCEYFLLGLKEELKKVDLLLCKEYLKTKILIPALRLSLESEDIAELEFKILVYLLNKPKMSIKSEELSKFGIDSSSKKTRIMSKLRNKKIIAPMKEGKRFYTIKFLNNHLLRGVVRALDNNGFISEFLNKN